MADIKNQENFNKIFSVFIGTMLVVFFYSLFNKNRVVIVENIKN